ncbi:hypothetical protein DIPPA_02123 [Diplonema papillatum]|nr:hypothetical protein DIPPA_02123 [Diplonema papillatum]
MVNHNHGKNARRSNFLNRPIGGVTKLAEETSNCRVFSRRSALGAAAGSACLCRSSAFLPACIRGTGQRFDRAPTPQTMQAQESPAHPPHASYPTAHHRSEAPSCRFGPQRSERKRARRSADLLGCSPRRASLRLAPSGRGGEARGLVVC